jgi:iron(III) transport system substrate-binding protein
MKLSKKNNVANMDGDKLLPLRSRFRPDLLLVVCLAFLISSPANLWPQSSTKAGSYESYVAGLVESAKKEGKLIFYSSHTEEPGVATIGQLFGKQYSFLKVEEIMEASNSRLMERMRLEIKAGRSPDAAAIGGGAQAQLKDDGLLREYTSPLEEQGFFRKEYESKHHYWTPYAFRTLHNVYNKNIVRADELTTDYTAWFNPKWKRKIGIDIGGTFWQWWTAMEKRYSIEKAADFMKKFADNEPLPFFSNSQIRNLVAAGELPFGNYIYLDNILVMQKKGAPIEIWNADPLPFSASNVSLLKDAPHPNAAKLFVEFLLSVPVQQERAKRTMVVPVRKDLDTPYPQYFKANFVSVESDEVRAAEERQRKLYEKFFRVPPQKK